MQFKSSIVAAAALAGVALAQTNAFSVATPQTLVQCQPYQINITGGTPPFNIRVTAAGDTSNVIESLTETSSRQVTWTVNVASGTTITLYVVDSTGAGAASGISNSIGTGSSSCLNSSASVSTGSGSGSTSAGGSTSQTSGTTQTTGATTSRATTSSSSTPSSSGTNGAGQLSGFSAVVAGAVGVVVAALF